MRPSRPLRAGPRTRSGNDGEFRTGDTAKIPRHPEERALIEQKMAQLGTTNMAAYLRKMAIDGYVVNLELPEVGELVSLLRRSSK